MSKRKITVKILSKGFYVGFFFMAATTVPLLVMFAGVWMLAKGVAGWCGLSVFAFCCFPVLEELALYVYSWINYKKKRFTFDGRKISYGPNEDGSYLSLQKEQVSEVEVFSGFTDVAMRSYCRVTLQDGGWFVFDMCNGDEILPYLIGDDTRVEYSTVWNRFSILPM